MRLNKKALKLIALKYCAPDISSAFPGSRQCSNCWQYNPPFTKWWCPFDNLIVPCISGEAFKRILLRKPGGDRKECLKVDGLNQNQAEVWKTLEELREQTCGVK